MAGPAALIRTVSELTGLPLPTVTDIDRRLVTAGLRSKGGRGLNAARMTALDAARLLTAILASPLANEAADAVDRYTRTKLDTDRSSPGGLAAAGLGDLSKLAARHGFVDALSALITSAASGDLSRLASHADKDASPHIEVFAFTRATYGRIRLSGLPNKQVVNAEYVPASARAARATASPGDLEQSRRITTLTVLGIANLLAGESSDECRSQ